MQSRHCLLFFVDISLMNSPGLIHGDAHLVNILTEGHRLYFADLGLATSDRFALSRRS